MKKYINILEKNLLLNPFNKEFYDDDDFCFILSFSFSLSSQMTIEPINLNFNFDRNRNWIEREKIDIKVY